MAQHLHHSGEVNLTHADRTYHGRKNRFWGNFIAGFGCVFVLLGFFIIPVAELIILQEFDPSMTLDTEVFGMELGWFLILVNAGIGIIMCIVGFTKVVIGKYQMEIYQRD